jgi:hypothetical protein
MDTKLVCEKRLAQIFTMTSHLQISLFYFENLAVKVVAIAVKGILFFGFRYQSKMTFLDLFSLFSGSFSDPWESLLISSNPR